MDASNFTSKIDRLELIVMELVKKQDAFIKKALMKLSLNSKDVYSSEEAAEFLSIEVKYIYQLTHQRKIRDSKKKGQKKIYFRKADLLDYLNGEIISTTEDLENTNAALWKK
ncbi:helix-turn-helix domain-containing protein [Flavobacterium sp. Fl-77]|uniref:Helix-turn-helix domain-containing protein n=1 Tax=Flavobacterium flavipigmentatum TaxID=2893884 RepID=A0AAJ2SDD3_9FLAO|nr:MULTISPECIES: helix-turn-helix domain-containing protein [unclassified Flavobacterium]MDX6180684.1 helix-turn-helix domain-containing protein [Flavobacterium sp. Fl-33]MDX6184284.1 helix-turn-helix domain-containing protein [Flavobacterium sp. Fl-77]UFH39396.1 helix-turn-helix domain-containing protein [Flavobacterium sp. F-70]